MIALVVLAGCRTTLSSDAEPMEDPTAAWNAVLGVVVTDDGLVDYDALERNRLALDEYVAWIAGPDVIPDSPRKRLAFWLNAYNAMVLFGVLHDGRPASVRDVPGFWSSKPGVGFFFERQFAVGPERVSLWDVENERVRGRSQDYRVHAAMNCASRSCPPLRDELYVGLKLDGQLDDQMRRWVSDPDRGVRIEGDVAVVSPIFEWYVRDFSEWTAGENLCGLLSRYAIGSLREDLRDLSRDGCPHRTFDYDGRLNDASER